MEKKLVNHLLVAVPGMADPFFGKSVIYILEHGDDGAMGLIINKPMLEEDVSSLISDIGFDNMRSKPAISFGGPVALKRGFILHSTDYAIEGTYRVSDSVSLTTDRKIIKEIADGRGPAMYKFILGYAGWHSGQLEQELKRGDWLLSPASPDLIFQTADDKKWQDAIQMLGLDGMMFSGDGGMA